MNEEDVVEQLNEAIKRERTMTAKPHSSTPAMEAAIAEIIRLRRLITFAKTDGYLK